MTGNDQSTNAGRNASSSEPPNILVVDCPEIQHFIRAALSKYGYCIMACTIQEALRFLNHDEPAPAELVITNAPRPFMERHARVRILYISSSPDPDVVSEAGSRGVGVLLKPFRVNALVASVRRLLEQGA